ncbi:hypothetical protein CBOM_06659 [Ceraceosorus bombacis]|uniref:Uncharacterized protein n=1 Tax=Ceraceosorus bombacis TaxID=401625 RepID=A0A0P1BQR3_9BASI|nr:hypothetical protein CBOM_06659 [Ceraceosorus bombacis]
MPTGCLLRLESSTHLNDASDRHTTSIRLPPCDAFDCRARAVLDSAHFAEAGTDWTTKGMGPEDGEWSAVGVRRISSILLPGPGTDWTTKGMGPEDGEWSTVGSRRYYIQDVKMEEDSTNPFPLFPFLFHHSHSALPKTAPNGFGTHTDGHPISLVVMYATGADIPSPTPTPSSPSRL